MFRFVKIRVYKIGSWLESKLSMSPDAAFIGRLGTDDIAVISIDPSRRKSGGAVLGCRICICMSAIAPRQAGVRTRPEFAQRFGGTPSQTST